MTFDDQLRILVYFHLKDFKSGRHLLQDLQQDEYAKTMIAPSGGMGNSTFFDALNERGLEQFFHVFPAFLIILESKGIEALPKPCTTAARQTQF